MTTKTKTKAPSLNDHPGYREASEKLTALQAEHSQLQAQIDELVEQFGQSSQAELTEEATALLSGKPPEGRGKGRLAELRHRAAVIDTAINLQRQAVAREEREALQKLYEARRDEHLSLIRRGTEAVEELVGAFQAIEAFRAEFRGPFSHRIGGLNFGANRLLEHGLRQIDSRKFRRDQEARFGKL